MFPFAFFSGASGWEYLSVLFVHLCKQCVQSLPRGTVTSLKDCVLLLWALKGQRESLSSKLLLEKKKVAFSVLGTLLDSIRIIQERNHTKSLLRGEITTQKLTLCL